MTQPLSAGPSAPASPAPTPTAERTTVSILKSANLRAHGHGDCAPRLLPAGHARVRARAWQRQGRAAPPATPESAHPDGVGDAVLQDPVHVPAEGKPPRGFVQLPPAEAGARQAVEARPLPIPQDARELQRERTAMF